MSLFVKKIVKRSFTSNDMLDSLLFLLLLSKLCLVLSSLLQKMKLLSLIFRKSTKIDFFPYFSLLGIPFRAKFLKKSLEMADYLAEVCLR